MDAPFDKSENEAVDQNSERNEQNSIPNQKQKKNVIFNSKIFECNDKKKNDWKQTRK